MAQSAGAVEYTDCSSAVPPPTNECPGYDTKQSDGEYPVMLELWGLWNTPLLPSPLIVLSMGQMELNCMK